MRKITADYIFPVTGTPLKNGVLIIDEQGKILAVEKNGTHSSSELEYYEGFLTPGFVNAHTHLELAGMKGKMQSGTGLGNFIVDLQQNRDNIDNKDELIRQADQEMYENGIVAASDISNSRDSFAVKASSNIKYHTFIEVFGLDPAKAEVIFNKAKDIETIAREEYGLKVSLSPHAPYSLSKALFGRIKQYAEGNNTILTMHNQESRDENDMFMNKSGGLINALGSFADMNVWEAPGMHSLPGVFQWISPAGKLLLVHNTYTTGPDIKTVSHHKNIFWVMAPNANLFIEKKLPDIDLFLKQKQIIAIGTDSYASNKSMSVLEELITFTTNFSHLSLNEMIAWATLNGAISLGLDHELGSFDKGKKPGVNLIKNVDVEGMKLTKSSRVQNIL